MRGKLVLHVLPLLLSINGCSKLARNADKAEATSAPTPAGPADEKEGSRTVAATAAPPAVVTPEPAPMASAASPARAAHHAPAGPAPVTATPLAKPGRFERDGDDFGGGGLGLAGRGGEKGGWAAPPSQFAGVKAGEWDDNANYREFTRFLASSHGSFHRTTRASASRAARSRCATASSAPRPTSPTPPAAPSSSRTRKA
jgi:hypothetical protein